MDLAGAGMPSRSRRRRGRRVGYEGGMCCAMDLGTREGEEEDVTEVGVSDVQPNCSWAPWRTGG